MKTFKINDYTYVKDSNGIISQLDPEPFVYDENYISCYDAPEYVDNDKRLQEIRLKFIDRYIPGLEIKNNTYFGTNNIPPEELYEMLELRGWITA